MAADEKIKIEVEGSNETKAAFKEIQADTEKTGEKLEDAGTKGKGFFSGMMEAASGFLAAGVIEKIGEKFTEAAGEALGMAGDVKQTQNDLQASLGLTKDKAAELSNVAVQVFRDNWGDSVGDAGEAVGEVTKQLGGLLEKTGELKPDNLKHITEQALTLRDTFGLDVNESVSTAKTLMEQFGMTSDQAFDFITAGVQKGLNRSGDFLDTINEYSTQFKNGGASADQFFSLLETGLQGGALGTDKAADAFKEFRVRIQDGSVATSTALKQLGIDSDKLSADMANGTVTAADAYQMVLDKLRETDDQNIVMQAGVGLLGGQFEDLGTKSVLGMSMAKTSLADLAGATDGLNVKYDNLGAVGEGLWRRFIVALLPASQALLDLANAAMPLVNAAFDQFEGALNIIIPLAVSGFQNVRDTVAGWLPVLQPAIAFIQSNAQPILVGIAVAIASVVIPAFIAWSTAAAAAAATTIAALLPVLVPLAAVGAAAAVLYAAWQSNFGGIRDITDSIMAAVQNLINTALAKIKSWWDQHGAQVISTVTNLFNTARDIAQTVLGAVSAWIQSVLGKIASWWDAHGESVMKIVGFLFNTVSTIVTTVFGAVASYISRTLESLATFWNTHGETVKKIVGAAWDLIQKITGTLFDTLGGLFDAFASATEGDWSGFTEKLKKAWDTLWQGLKSALEGFTGTIGGMISGFITDITGKFNNTDWGAVGTNIINSIATAIRNGASTLLNAAAQVALDALNAAKHALGISSPSKKFMEVGRFAMEGFAEGVRKSTAMPALAVRGAADSALAAITVQAVPAVPVRTGGDVYLTVNNSGEYRTAVEDINYLRSIAR